MKAHTRHAPIAVFDSGAGGIGVLRELQKKLPCEDFLYFGDAMMAPYGEREHDEIKALVLSHAARLLTTAKALVVACNTATAVAIDDNGGLVIEHNATRQTLSTGEISIRIE